jgi:hypothetical protein
MLLWLDYGERSIRRDMTILVAVHNLYVLTIWSLCTEYCHSNSFWLAAPAYYIPLGQIIEHSFYDLSSACSLTYLTRANRSQCPGPIQ